jgi:hypothetical protein
MEAGVELERAELAEKIVDLVNRKWQRLKLTELDLAEWICGHEVYKSRVNDACRWLVDEGRLKREGEGVANSPYWYRPAPPSNFKRRV